MGLTIASSGACGSQLSNLLPQPKEVQPITDLSTTEGKEGSEPELLNNGIDFANISAGRYEFMKKFDKNTWQHKAYDAFAAKLGEKEKTFPCNYASKGWRDNNLIYTFLPSEDCTERTNVLAVARAILAYQPNSHKYGCNTSLVVLTPNSKKKRMIEEYHSLFWGFCKPLRQIDPKPWPSHISEDTESNRWYMCFDGKPAFIAVLTPAHEKRRTRYLPNFCFVWQPRWVFKLLLTSDEKRAATLKNVRGLIDKYDYPLPHSPDFSNFGDPESSEAKEYFIWDENRPATAQMPRCFQEGG
ncbi:MAG: hypothetical protein LQ351_006050 [Letrouitia transgressa]|nr:MAG: hypothetical protein LQ351_006050 [Letrouitia transgressa]